MPCPVHDPGFWALVGMAAMLGGSLRAPLTGAVFAFELTGNFHGLPALLTATVAAYAVTVLLLRRSILTEKIARRGRHVTQEYAIDPYELARASEIMVTDVATLTATTTIADAVAWFASPQNAHRSYPVVDAENRLVGVVTRADALRWQQAHGGETADLPNEILADQVSDPASAAPDHVVSYVLDLMIAEDTGLIPVVDPATRELRGIITRKDLLAVRRSASAIERQRARFYARRRPAKVSSLESEMPVNEHR